MPQLYSGGETSSEVGRDGRLTSAPLLSNFSTPLLEGVVFGLAIGAGLFSSCGFSSLMITKHRGGRWTQVDYTGKAETLFSFFALLANARFLPFTGEQEAIAADLRVTRSLFVTLPRSVLYSLRHHAQSESLEGRTNRGVAVQSFS